MLDLLVIGAGLSGLSAALTAARAGLRVRVVAKGLGALHWHTGGIDVLGYLPGTDAPVDNPFTTIHRLPDDHPYRRLAPDAIEQALRAIVAELRGAGLELQGAAGDPQTGAPPEAQHNLRLPTAVGALRPVWHAPTAQLGGRLDDPRPMVIVGFEGLRDFYPGLIAHHLTQQGYPARAEWLPLSVLAARGAGATVHLAQALDDDAAWPRLAAALKPRLRAQERAGLPALLGDRRHAHAHAALEAELQAPVFEIPTLPPSVPGIRMHRALLTTLHRAGVRVEAGMEVVSSRTQDGWVESVETATAGRPLRHEARAFLLATGGVLGGGFQSDSRGRIWEPIFDLPLTTPQARSRWLRARFLDPQGHPVFTGGVAVDEAWQPIDGAGRPCYTNLWAAGNALTGCDAIRERSIEGLAIATGVAAAHAIVDRLGAPQPSEERDELAAT